MSLAEEVTTKEQARKHAGIILEIIKYSSQDEINYDNLRTTYQGLRKRAVELGEIAPWRKLPKTFYEAKRKLR